MINIPVTFTLDLSKQYQFLKIAITICPDEFEFTRLTTKISKVFKTRRKSHGSPGALHVGLTTNSPNTINDPVSLIVLKKNYPIQVVVHELFHAARHYFRLTGHRINEDYDEVFAHLLENMVEGFTKQSRVMVEQGRNTLALKVRAKNE